jgi:hypothetical protein
MELQGGIGDEGFAGAGKGELTEENH